jgi:hypothetical protein
MERGISYVLNLVCKQQENTISLSPLFTLFNQGKILSYKSWI